jgi:esterase/lipase superfamily enzyme
MRIYFATNRDPNNSENPTDFGSRFSTKGLTDLRFGWAEVSGSKFDQYQLTVATESLETSKAKAAVGDFSEQKLGSLEVFQTIRQEMKQLKQDCVIFVHGFNTSFGDALQRAAQLKEFYSELPLTFFLFTWPSDGELLFPKGTVVPRAYANDRDDARASGAALGRGMQKFAAYLSQTKPKDFCNQNVHLFAHSMGIYALRWALQGIKSTSGNNLRRLLEHVMLFGADEDDDAFEFDYKLQPLPDMARRVTVYHNAGDLALLASDATKNNPDRLGAGGPRNSRALPDKVSVVNCEPVINRGQEIAGHHYDRLNNTVRQDVIAVLKGAEPQDIKTRKYQPETRSYRLKK